MAVHTILPTSSLKIEDIRDTLAANGGSVSNDTTTFFTTAAKINPWSKHKPVALSSDFCQDFDSSRADYDDDWWKGNDGKCGLYWNTFAWGGPTSDTIPNVKASNWTYTPPSSSYPRRLGDFAGYVVSVNPPIATRITASKIAVDQNTNTWTFEPDIYPQNNNELSAYDFDKSLQGWYVCAAVYQSGWNIYIGDSVLTSGCKVSVNLNDFNVGEHEVVLCLATGTTGNFMPLPSNSDNKTNFILDIRYEMPYYIDITEVGSYWNNTQPISNYQNLETFYPASDAVYFKAIVTKGSANTTSISASELTGWSPTWSGGETTRSMSGRMRNSSGTSVNSISLSSIAVGSSIVVYFYWDGYGSFNDIELGETFIADFNLSNSDGAVIGSADFVMKKM